MCLFCIPYCVSVSRLHVDIIIQSAVAYFHWSLPSRVVTSTSVDKVKNNLDDHWNDVGTKS